MAQRPPGPHNRPPIDWDWVREHAPKAAAASHHRNLALSIRDQRRRKPRGGSLHPEQKLVNLELSGDLDFYAELAVSPVTVLTNLEIDGVADAAFSMTRVATTDFYYSESLTQSTHTGDANFTDKVTLDLTPVTGDLYYLLAAATLSLSTTTSNVSGRLTDVTGNSALVTGVYRVAEAASPQSFLSWGAVDSITAPSSATYSLSLQYQDPASTPTAYCQDASLLAIREVSATDQYTEDNTTSTDAAGGTWLTKTSLTFTPATAGDYLIIGFARILSSVATDYLGVRLNWETGAVTTGGLSTYAQTTSNRPAHFYMAQHTLSAVSNTISLQFQRISGTGTCSVDQARVLAVRLDRFTYASASQSTPQTTTSATYVDAHSVTVSVPASGTGTVYLLATGWYQVASTTVSGYMKVYNDTSAADICEVNYVGNVTDDWKPLIVFRRLSLTPGNTYTFKFQIKAETAGTTVNADDMTFFVFGASNVQTWNLATNDHTGRGYMTATMTRVISTPAQDERNNLWMGMNLNMDILNSQAAAQLPFYRSFLNSSFPAWFLYTREDLSQPAQFNNAWSLPAYVSALFDNSGGTVGCTWNFTGGVCHGLINGTHLQFVNKGTPAYGADWVKNMQWSVYKHALAMPNSTYVRLWKPINEPENPAQPDYGNLGAAAESAAVHMQRCVQVHKVCYEQLKGITQGAGMNNPVHDGVVVGPSMAKPGYIDAYGTWGEIDILTYNDGEILTYLAAYNIHQHENMSNIESFQGTPPVRGGSGLSFYHSWDALKTAQAARTAAGKSTIALPIMCDEGGRSIQTSTGWDDTADHLGTLRAHRYASFAQTMHWFGMSEWTHYSYIRSGGAGGAFNWRNASSPFSEIGNLETKLGHILDYTYYDELDLVGGALTISAKADWTTYNLPYDWAVFVGTGSPPENSFASGLAPWNAYRRVTFASNLITCVSTPTQTNGPAAALLRNLIYRWVYLRYPGSQYTVTAECQFTAGGSAAQAILRCRGYDKLNGLAEANSGIKNGGTAGWQLCTATFTTRQHTSPIVRNPCYVTVCLDHNRTGTVQWRNVTITRNT